MAATPRKSDIIYWFIGVQAGVWLCELGRRTLESLTASGASSVLALFVYVVAQVFLAARLPQLRSRTVFALNYALGALSILLEHTGIEFGGLAAAGKTFEGAASDKALFLALMLFAWAAAAAVLTMVNHLAVRTLFDERVRDEWSANGKRDH